VILAALAALFVWHPALRSCLGGEPRRALIAGLWMVATVLAMLAVETVPETPDSIIAAGLGFSAGTVAVLLTADVSVRRLPLRPSLVSALVFLVAVGISDPGRLVGTVASAGIMTLITRVLRKLSAGQLGRGDVFLSPLLGALIGWFDPWAIGTAWLITAFAAALFSCWGLLLGRIGRRSLIPYGPFLVLGAVTAIGLTIAVNP
jgi:prepilin signal peptidase PulO-like enzyme (type II secretory pathway)